MLANAQRFRRRSALEVQLDGAAPGRCLQPTTTLVEIAVRAAERAPIPSVMWLSRSLTRPVIS